MLESGRSAGCPKAKLSHRADSETTKEAPPLESTYYIGPEVHESTISYCVKDARGRIYAHGKIPATRCDLDLWRETLPGPWMAAVEATMSAGWIYDHLSPPCRRAASGSSADAAGHYRGEKEE